MSSVVTYRRHKNGYSIIQLNRPHKRNAINNKVANKLKEHLKRAKADRIKFLVITGSGNMFCAGGDLTEFHDSLSEKDSFSLLYPMKEVLFEIATFPTPTICLLNGDALGGGCEIATACDFRMALEGTKFGFIQTSLGIVPGWGGGALLYEKVHPTFAYQWLLEGQIHDVAYLKNKNWIQSIISAPQWENNEQLLAPYVKKSLKQLRALKNQYVQSISITRLNERMTEEVKMCAKLWESEEHKRAVQQFFNKN